MRIIVLTLFIFLAIVATRAQTNADSLYSIWQNETQADSVRVAAYVKYIRDNILFSNPDSALILADNLFRYAEEHNCLLAEAQGYRLKGNATYIKGIYSPSLKYHEKALKTFEEVGFKKGYANSLANIGTLHKEQGNFLAALEYIEKTSKILDEIDYNQLRVYIEGMTGSIYKEKGDYPRALESYEKALTISKEIGFKQGVANNLGNIGSIFLLQKNYSDALEYHEMSLEIAEEIEDKQQITSSLHSIGNIYREQDKYFYALEHCQRSMNLAKEMEALEIQKDACQCLYGTYKAMGKVNEALEYLEKVRVIEDSLNTEETAKMLEQMEFARIMLQDSIAKAEEARLVQEAHEEEMRKEETTRNMSIGVGAFILLLAISFYSRLRFVRKSKAIIEKEKDRSENLLLNILPEEIAQELKEKGKAEARDFDMVSILFTDFKSFTEQSAKLSAAELVNEINHCFEAFDGIIEKYNVEKIKTIGDAYMAAGGLPVPSDDSVKNTVLAALEMQAFIARRKAENDAANKPAFQMRAGIHTGSVVAGIVGVKKFQYDIWGDTVNTASRIESNGKVDKVNISQAAFEILKDDPDFAFESRGKIKAKGKGEIEMYFVSKT